MNTNKSEKKFPTTDQTYPLEIANALSHGLGCIVGIALLPVVTAISTRVDRISAIVAAAIYAFCFIMMFIFSTLYHAVQDPEAIHSKKNGPHFHILLNCRNVHTISVNLSIKQLWHNAFIRALESCTHRNIFQNSLCREIQIHKHVNLSWHGLDSSCRRENFHSRNSHPGYGYDFCRRRALHTWRSILLNEKMEIPPCHMAPVCTPWSHMPLCCSFACCY